VAGDAAEVWRRRFLREQTRKGATEDQGSVRGLEEARSGRNRQAVGIDEELIQRLDTG
jgi:hypothetical protein